MVDNYTPNQKVCQIWPKHFRILWFMPSFGVCSIRWQISKTNLHQRKVNWHFLDFNVSNRDFKTDVNKISKSVLTVSCWWSAASRSGHSGGQTKKIFWGHIFKHHSLNGRWVQKSSNQLIYLSWMKYIVHTYFNA